MVRRTRVPDRVRAELSARAQAGIGHDPTVPTVTAYGTVPAAEAVAFRPSGDMLVLVQQVVSYLRECDVRHVDVQVDVRDLGCPGAVTVRWHGGVSPLQVASRFAVSTAPNGIPRIPAWLSLRADDQFDLRWQPPY